jgi:hypothetical protein
VRPTERVAACSDPDDDIFLECAQAARADYLVTGNLKHFPVSWAATRIVTPRWLLDSLSAEKPGRTSESFVRGVDRGDASRAGLSGQSTAMGYGIDGDSGASPKNSSLPIKCRVCRKEGRRTLRRTG